MPILPANELLAHARSVLKPTTIQCTNNLGQRHYESIGPDGVVATDNRPITGADDFYVVNDKYDGSYAKLKPYLFVGSEDLSRNLEKLKEIGITHVLNLATYCPNSFPDDFTYLQIKIFDMPEKDIQQHFQNIIDFIEEARTSEGAAYVHCNAGISRAPTSCIAYLMWKDKVTKATAYEYIRSKRFVLPNDGFMAQLNRFEIDLELKGSKNTVNPEA
ncbi:dual specificity protein phosphatase 19-like [Symsagittifera roscoffensis]|uniref:dual specificity protein phosphatase 19-like n=1 Tax=Symsagittifera roscoffensis TaxID=84072 RepID=UPI00307C8EA8